MALTHYDTLAISTQATAVEIRLAYRRQAQRWHPDRQTGVDSHQRFVEIQEAYRVLGDPHRRRVYDETLFPSSEQKEAPGSLAATPAPSGPGEALHLLARVRIADLYAAGSLALTGQVGMMCSRCHGQGCRRCGGAGQVLVRRRWVLERPARWRPTEMLRLASAGHVGPFYPTPGDVLVVLNPLPSYGWRWSSRAGRLEKSIRVPAHLLKSGGKWPLQAPWGEWGSMTIPATSLKSTWVTVEGLGLGPSGAPDAVGVHVGVEGWFSWGYRRQKQV